MGLQDSAEELIHAATWARRKLEAQRPETLGHAPGKWWALSVAQLSAMDRYEILSATDTVARAAAACSTRSGPTKCRATSVDCAVRCAPGPPG